MPAGGGRPRARRRRGARLPVRSAAPACGARRGVRRVGGAARPRARRRRARRPAMPTPCRSRTGRSTSSPASTRCTTSRTRRRRWPRWRGCWHPAAGWWCRTTSPIPTPSRRGSGTRSSGSAIPGTGGCCAAARSPGWSGRRGLTPGRRDGMDVDLGRRQVDLDGRAGRGDRGAPGRADRLRPVSADRLARAGSSGRRASVSYAAPPGSSRELTSSTASTGMAAVSSASPDGGAPRWRTSVMCGRAVRGGRASGAKGAAAAATTLRELVEARIAVDRRPQHPRAAPRAGRDAGHLQRECRHRRHRRPEGILEGTRRRSRRRGRGSAR